VQASSKNPKYDEILLRKTKSAGDITVPTSVVMISTNCVEVIKSSCQEEKKIEPEDGETDEIPDDVPWDEDWDEDEEQGVAADKPSKPRKGDK
jgi:hypothetical protein